MASTYSNLKIQLMATGENSGTWGNVTNDNLGVAIEQALVETATVSFSSANVTLTLSNTNASQTARALRLNLTGTTGGARDLIVPAIQKPYIVNNNCADTVTVKVTGQTGVAVPAGRSYLLYNNGTDVVNALEGISVVSGGTGLETLTAESVVIGNGTNAVKFVAPGTNGNVLTSNGSSWSSTAAAAATRISGGTTGLTPNTLSSGDVTLAGTLVATNGGTGRSTLTANNILVGNGTAAVNFIAAGTAGNVLTSNGTTWASAALNPTTGEVLTATSSASAGGVGTYVLAQTTTGVAPTTTVCNPGDTIAGSSLFYGGLTGYVSLVPSDLGGGTTLSGTWRCMGFLRNTLGIDGLYLMSLFLRTA